MIAGEGGRAEKWRHEIKCCGQTFLENHLWQPGVELEAFQLCCLFCHRFQLREEKVQEEKASEDLIHKLMVDDMEVGKRKMEEQQKKDESLVLKVNQECVSKIVLSRLHQRHQPGEILLRSNPGAGVRFLKTFLPLTLHAFQDWFLYSPEGYELTVHKDSY